jgi:Zn-finger nucleic acid-binding protein
MRTRCPRCKAALQDQEYEGEQVEFCPGCFGHWLTRDQLDKIVNTVEFKFSKREADAVLGAMTLVGDESRFVDEVKLISCPECDRQMTREKYHPRCVVQIDTCPDHGVWLDTGEIKDLQVFVEKKILGHEHA